MSLAEERAAQRRLARMQAGRAQREATQVGERAPSPQQYERTVRQQARQIATLRSKVDLLHESLVASRAGIGACTIDDPLGALMPIECRRVPTATTTVFCFSGMAIATALPRREFYRSLVGSDANLIFVKDYRECWYQRGLLGMSSNVEQTAILLRQLAPVDNKIAMTGTSAGGFAAILFGVLVGAHRIVAFAPQTIIDEDAFHNFKTSESQWDDVMSGNRMYLDLHAILRRHRFLGIIDLYYSSDLDVDRTAAERLQEFPCVRLHARPGDAHSIAGKLKQDGELSTILADLLS